MIHVPGTSHAAADATIRYPSRDNSSESQVDETSMVERCCNAYAVMQASKLPASLNWEDVYQEAKVDRESIALKELIQTKFPEKREYLPAFIRYYWTMKEDLYVIDDVIFKGIKMLIPLNLRRQVLEGLHAAHQGTTSMALNARERLFWPNLQADLKAVRERCRLCNENSPSQKA